MTMCCSNILAQSGAGSIQGTVTDSTGAVIVGATIQAINQATSVVANAKSNGVGFYQVPALFTGTYTVTYTAAGMKSYRTSIELLVNQNAVINPVMTAGAVTQQIEVAADAVQLTTTNSGTVGATLENARINQLPMNGRLLLTLAGESTPGIEMGNGSRPNGLMAEAMEYVQDGISLANRNFGGEKETQSQLPDPDAVQEVRLETTNTSAQYSEPATGIITTKSGTNGLHGSFFETARNNAIGIARARQDPTNLVVPHLVRNEFGASAGGPIILPHVYHGKDKSFWFFAYERFSLRQLSSQRNNVPTLAMRQGDFSGLVNGSNVLQQLYDPNTTYNSGSANCPGTPTSTTNPNGANPYCRKAFANNQIPISRLAPGSKLLQDITPLPTTTDNPLITSNIIVLNPISQTIPNMTFRFDHSFNETNRAYMRYTNTNMLQRALRNTPSAPGTVAADGFPALADGNQDQNTVMFTGVVGFTHVFSPTFYSETIVGQEWWNEWFSGGPGNQNNYEKMFGTPNNFGEPGFPSFNGLFMLYPGTQWNYGISQIVSNLDENLTKTSGKHEMHFGGRYRHERFGYLADRNQDGITFGGQATGLENPATGASYGGTSNAGNANADMFLGAANNYSVQLQPPYTHYHDMELDAYFQDDYHVTRNLTVNLGMRYEAHPAAWTKDGMLVGFDMKTDQQVLPNPTSFYVAKGYTTQGAINNLANLGAGYETPQQAGLPNGLLKNYLFTLSPRLGVAYQPFGGKHGTVIRGAYGRYIYPIPIRNFQIQSLKMAPLAATFSQNYLAANQSPDGLAGYLLRAPQQVVMGLNSSNVVDSTSATAIIPGFNVTHIASDAAPDYVTEVNATVEQPLKGNSALRVSWVWTHGTNLDHFYYFNFHPSTFVWEMATGTTTPSGGASVIGTSQQNTYAATATGPYDQTKYGGSSLRISKDGWSNDNSLQLDYRRNFNHGIAYQVLYVWSKAFRLGGNTFRDGQNYPATNYLGVLGSQGTMSLFSGTTAITPATPPVQANAPAWAPSHALYKFENYQVDSAIPFHHIQFNGILDLPFGRGKRFFGNSNSFMNELIGGFSLAGDGNIVSEVFQPGAGNWGATNPLKVYKHKAPITDCRSGVCHASFEWFNGYLAPTVVNAASKGVSGLPSDYVPYSTPINNNPLDTTNYGTNNVKVTLLNGQTQTQSYGSGTSGANPYSKTFLPGPINYTVDLSLFKVFAITEKANVRVNVDAFNALNVQGYNNPGGDGTENLLSSHNTPRQIQLTMRLTF